MEERELQAGSVGMRREGRVEQFSELCAAGGFGCKPRGHGRGLTDPIRTERGGTGTCVVCQGVPTQPSSGVCRSTDLLEDYLAVVFSPSVGPPCPSDKLLPSGVLVVPL